MKAIINNQLLVAVLNSLSDACNQRAIVPVVLNVSISVKGGIATFHQTNLNLHIVNKVECTADGDFDILVPFHELKKITSLCTGPVMIGEKNGFAYIESGEDVWKMGKADAPKDYPKLPEFDLESSFNADGTFFWALHQAATTTKTGDYALGNICLDIKKDEIVVVSTDTMSMFHFLQNNADSVRKIVPRKVTFAPSFAKSVSTFQDSEVTIGNKYIEVECEDIKVISVLSDIGFINYEMVSNIKRQPNCTVNLGDLTRAIKKVMASRSNLGFYHITFTLSKDKIKMHFREDDKEVILDIAAETDVESSVKLNAENLLNSLSQMPPLTHDVKLSIDGPAATVYMYPADNEALFLVLAPIINQPITK